MSEDEDLQRYVLLGLIIKAPGNKEVTDMCSKRFGLRERCVRIKLSIDFTITKERGVGVSVSVSVSVSVGVGGRRRTRK